MLFPVKIKLQYSHDIGQQESKDVTHDDVRRSAHICTFEA